MSKFYFTVLDFYKTKSNFFVRLLKSLIIFLPIIFIWNILSGFIIEDLLHIKIPSLEEMLGKYKFSSFTILFIAAIFAPITETLFFQKWCFQILNWIFKVTKIEIQLGDKKTITYSTIITSILFAASHYSNHAFYPLLVFPIGLLLGWIYQSNLLEFQSKSRAYWMTCAFHCLYNTLVTSMYFLFEV